MWIEFGNQNYGKSRVVIYDKVSNQMITLEEAIILVGDEFWCTYNGHIGLFINHIRMELQPIDININNNEDQTLIVSYSLLDSHENLLIWCYMEIEHHPRWHQDDIELKKVEEDGDMSLTSMLERILAKINELEKDRGRSGRSKE